MKQLAPDTFNKIVENLKRDSNDTDLQSITFIGKYCNYQLSFYAEEETNHEVVIQDFGYSQGSKYYECALNEEQITKLQCVVDIEIKIVEDNIKNENSEGFTDDYESPGHKQSDFY